jgi:transcription elongation factor SPT4
MREGCPNCDHILNLRGNTDAIQECTSQVFEGLITIADERSSWVARWQRLDGYVSGTYAVKVTGSVSYEYIFVDGRLYNFDKSGWGESAQRRQGGKNG